MREWIPIEGFGLTEDRSLRDWLLGLTVSDDQDRHRDVGVWFSHPDIEIRDQKYPYMVITLIDVIESLDRTMSWFGVTPPSMSADVAVNSFSPTMHEYFGLPTGPTDKFFSLDPPIPVYMDYQIKTFARHPRHDRAITRDVLSKKLPYRYGMLPLVENAGHRRLTMMDMVHQEFVETNKRLFSTSFTARVDTWLPTSRVQFLQQVLVRDVDLDLHSAEPRDIWEMNQTLNTILRSSDG